jgi:hypothetical protein
MEYDGNRPFIFGNKALDTKGITVFKTDAPFIADKLFEMKDKKWKECLEMLGINNANTAKKERLVTDEVNSNNQLLMFQADAMLMTRQFAVKEINEKFGLNISCELREDIEQEGGIEEVE